jgi:hypothetical protein
VDWDNDGKFDLIAGDSRGQVTVFLNTGTRDNPVLAKGFKVKAAGKTITRNSHPLAESYSKLHFADWNGDGLNDLLIGGTRNIVFYENIGTKSEPEFAKPKEIVNPDGKFPIRSSPYVFDWDDDGLQDLIIGVERGDILFYKNIGTANSPKLAKGQNIPLISDEFAQSYRHRLEIVDWNNDGKLDILCGERYKNSSISRGYIWLFLGK